MAEVRRRLSEEHGKVFDLAGERTAAFPLPDALLQLQDVPGLNAQKVDRLHAVAESALSGQLDVERIQRLGPDAAKGTSGRFPGSDRSTAR